MNKIRSKTEFIKIVIILLSFFKEKNLCQLERSLLCEHDLS